MWSSSATGREHLESLRTSPRNVTDYDNWVFPGVGESVSTCPPRLQTSSREVVLVDRSGRREIVTATAAALILGILVSWGTVYGLNRYLGPGLDPYETTGSVPTLPRSD
jgi:hypothetical protein